MASVDIPGEGFLPPEAGGSAPPETRARMKWRGCTHLVHLDLVPSLDRASPSTLKQPGAKVPQGQGRGTGIPKHWESLGTFNG